MTVNVKTQVKTKKKQQFVRLNVDEKLEQVLQEYEEQYSLLSRSDIVRMLISDAIYNPQKTQAKKKKSYFNKQQLDSINRAMDEIERGEGVTFESTEQMDEFFAKL